MGFYRWSSKRKGCDGLDDFLKVEIYSCNS